VPEQFEIIGHRGNGAGPFENTAASFEEALSAGATRLETDLVLQNGELMLAHPPRRPEMSLRELFELTDRPIVLHLKRRRLNPFHDQRVIRQLAPLVVDRPNVTVSSFWPGTLTFLKRHFPDIRTAFITYWPSYDLLFSHRLGAAEYHAWWRGCSERAIHRAERRNVRLITFVAPPTEEAKRRVRVPGIAGVITDHVAFFSGQRPAARRPRPGSARGSDRS
jgi:glycerophosphoryl diester phosphodiesterase